MGSSPSTARRNPCKGHAKKPTSVGIECEVKLEVASRRDLLAFLAVLPAPRRWGMQLNCYLDTPGSLLRVQGISLRVRVTPDHARLTLKSRRGREGATFRTEETEVEVERDAAIAWICHGQAFDLARIDGFEEVARLVRGQVLAVNNWSLTRRAICDTDDGITVEVDETVFPDGHRDFEIEAEDPDPDKALRVIQAFAALAGVALCPQSMTKHARADRHRGNRRLPIPEGDPWGPMPDGLDET